MIGYVMVGTNDLARATEFYDAVLGELGATRYIETERGVSWSTAHGKETSLAVTLPFDDKPATVGNGSMIALGVRDRRVVQKVYQKAISCGASDEGEPGPRGDSGFYAGYFRDLDGNKLNVFCIESSR
jgi:catechol 2,3-dioxygenase-like lactoylglutathione lyase family enzyme